MLSRPGGWLSRCCAYQGSFRKSSKLVVNSVVHIRESAYISRLCRDNQGCSENNYMHLSSKSPQNHFSSELSLSAYSRGMGALGLPGDLSSQSRFIRAAFTKMNSVSGSSELESISQFFHILGSVDQQRGCCDVGDEKYEITLYTSCCNADKGIYYYTTYENHQITAVDMNRENLNDTHLVRYPLIYGEQIKMQN